MKQFAGYLFLAALSMAGFAACDEKDDTEENNDPQVEITTNLDRTVKYLGCQWVDGGYDAL